MNRENFFKNLFCNMKKSEKIFGILFAIALIFKLALFPGGGIISVISLTALSCVYFYFGFAFFNNIKLKNVFKRKSYEGISALRMIGSIGTGMVLSTVCLGILFKLSHYPGGGFMLNTGLSTTFIISTTLLIKYLRSERNLFIMIGAGIGFGLYCTWILSIALDWHIYRYPLFQAGVLIILVASFVALINYYRSKTNFYIAVLSRIILIGGIGLLLTFKSFDIAITKVLYRNHPDLVKAYERYLYNPENADAHKQWRIEFEKTYTPQDEFVDE